MDAVIRYAKYAFAAPLINALLLIFPRLSRTSPPWRGINFGGLGDYVAIGDGVVGCMIRLADLAEGDTVVEIGSGIGGNATALYRRFGDRIAYRGFDVVRLGVTWCRQHFARLSQRYQFVHSNIYNSFYNPQGRTNPADYVFPYDDASADLAFANSVFTHMQPPEVAHYIHESGRIVRPGGLIWFTFFILDDDSEAQIAAGQSTYSFRHPQGDCRVENQTQPDLAVAYSAAWVERVLGDAGFEVRAIEPSSWRGRPASEFQDIVVAVRV